MKCYRLITVILSPLENRQVLVNLIFALKLFSSSNWKWYSLSNVAANIFTSKRAITLPKRRRGPALNERNLNWLSILILPSESNHLSGLKSIASRPQTKGETAETSRLKSYEVHLNQWNLSKSHYGSEVNHILMKFLEVSWNLVKSAVSPLW